MMWGPLNVATPSKRTSSQKQGAFSPAGNRVGGMETQETELATPVNNKGQNTRLEKTPLSGNGGAGSISHNDPNMNLLMNPLFSSSQKTGLMSQNKTSQSRLGSSTQNSKGLTLAQTYVRPQTSKARKTEDMHSRQNFFYQNLHGSNIVLTATNPSNSRNNLFAITPTSKEMKQINAEIE